MSKSSQIDYLFVLASTLSRNVSSFPVSRPNPCTSRSSTSIFSGLLRRRPKICGFFSSFYLHCLPTSCENGPSLIVLQDSAHSITVTRSDRVQSSGRNRTKNTTVKTIAHLSIQIIYAQQDWCPRHRSTDQLVAMMKGGQD